MRSILLALMITVLAATFAAAVGPMDVRGVTPEELQDMLDDGQRIVLLDVRSRGAYDSSDIKIKGAIRIPTDELPDRIRELPFGAAIATYCT